MAAINELGFQPAGFRIQGPIGDMLTSTAEKYGVDPDLVHSLAQQESGGNPAAQSPKGALGVMQLMPHTAQQLGVDPTDPAQNIDGGVRYLGQMLDKYDGDRDKALAAYNAGPGAVDAHNGVPPYKETQKYVSSINSRLAPATTQQSAPQVSDPEMGFTPEKAAPAANADPEMGFTPEAPAQAPAAEATPKITEHPWDYVNTPIPDLITGKKGTTQNWLTHFSGDDPTQFAQEHPWLNAGAGIVSGLSSPLSALLMLGGPVAKGLQVAGEAVPGLSTVASALNIARKAGNLAVAGEGASNAVQGGSDILQSGATTRNVAQTGLGTLQALLGLHGGVEMSGALDKEIPENLLSDGMRPYTPEGKAWTLGDLRTSEQTQGLNPDLAEATQNPVLGKLKNYLSGTYFGRGPLERNQTANQAVLDNLMTPAESQEDLEAAQTAADASRVKVPAGRDPKTGRMLPWQPGPASPETQDALTAAQQQDATVQAFAPTRGIFNNTLAATPGQHSMPELLMSYLFGHGLAAAHGPLGYAVTPATENIIARLLTSKYFNKIMLAPTNPAATVGTRTLSNAVSK